MALSAAEKMRRYREKIKSDPVRREQHREKERRRWHRRVADEKVITASKMTERQSRYYRKHWRLQRAKNRRAQKMSQQLLNDLNTPPCSPDTGVNEAAPRDRRQVRKRNVRKLKKELEKLQGELEREKRKKELYKKRYYRSKNAQTTESPRSRAMSLLRHASTPLIRRTLTFHNVMVDELKKKYSKTKLEVEKRKCLNFVTSSLFKKYGLQRLVQTTFGFSAKRWKKDHKGTSDHQKLRKKYDSAGRRLQHKIQSFYEQDDNSRILAGKKDTLTRGKIKRQKRLLSDSMKNLHEKYLRQNPQYKVSYSLFCRLRPFWVVPPKESDRETCACKLHENIQLCVDALKSHNVLPSNDLNDVVCAFTCDVNSKNCMYGQCETCKDPVISSPVDMNEEICWYQWKSVKEERIINGEKRLVTLVKKVEQRGSLWDLADLTGNHIERFKTHVFNIRHQFKFQHNLKETMGDNEVMVHVDFSENYQCKYGRAIQSTHFGASQKQITLHTGVYYIGSNDDAHTFCTISESLQHDPAAIWAHLEPIMMMIKDENPTVDVVHFFSDGPSTQYKQKKHFYLFQQNLPRWGFHLGTWNYMEAGHGKGAPDGVGAAVKRACDSMAKQGTDCVSINDVMSAAKGLNVCVRVVDQGDIDRQALVVDKEKLQTVPGTTKIHQIVYKSESQFLYRDVSCWCRPMCQCFNPSCFTYEPPSHTTQLPNGSLTETDSTPEGNQCPNSEDSNSDPARQRWFEENLDQLGRCQTFDEVKQMCFETILPEIGKYNLRCVSPNDLTTCNLNPDQKAFENLPSDVDVADMVPIAVSADGDCLPHSGSVLAFGHENNANEIRVRIVLELATQDKYYLDEDNISKGYVRAPGKKRKLLNNICMYSDQYMPGEKITQAKIQSIFESEVVQVCKKGEFMGMWQVMALSSVLACPVYSIYPERGNTEVRKDLNRLVVPRVQEEEVTRNVMWTSTRYEDMGPNHFAPNHFVPLLSIPSMSSELVREFGLLDNHVIISYDGRPYPGKVIDEDVGDIQVSCMHKVGSNKFFWPPRADICWYSKDNVLAAIPAPRKVTNRHYKIGDNYWNMFWQ